MCQKLEGHFSRFFTIFITHVQMGLGMDATFGDDFSVVNLPANLLFKQIELYVGNTNVWYLTFCKVFLISIK